MHNVLPQFDRELHGSLFDRGSADAYYQRPYNPHWYQNSKRIVDLTEEEILEYSAGYEEQQESGFVKEY